MRDLFVSMSAMEPGVDTAEKVITYFDDLAASHAGLGGLVRGAAVLADCGAGLSVPGRIQMRVAADGHRLESAPIDPGWTVLPLDPGTGGLIWLERTSPHHPAERLILERLAAAARIVLNRTQTPSPGHDPASVELLLDHSAERATRLKAAQRLGLPADGRARVVVTMALEHAPQPAGKLPPALARWRARINPVDASVIPLTTDWTGDPACPVRAGISPALPIDELPTGWQMAIRALRLTGEDTPADPGPRQLKYEDLGISALLTELPPSAIAANPDVRVLQETAHSKPWLIPTAAALTGHDTKRQAAAQLHIHHSTLDERLHSLHAILGYPPSTPQGRQRLHLTLTLLRLLRSADLGASHPLHLPGNQ
ncbi:MAG TPA: helix-turn-helix domain-containing protein [Streptosporangiaceae bacterium]|jgi:hypothetical protein|nr:helix-turn-helix domain-containing protein [Streptosporangiaceae bacterium]